MLNSLKTRCLCTVRDPDDDETSVHQLFLFAGNFLVDPSLVALVPLFTSLENDVELWTDSRIKPLLRPSQVWILNFRSVDCGNISTSNRGDHAISDLAHLCHLLSQPFKVHNESST